MHAIVKEEPPDLAETNRSVPPALERIVRHCLEKRPEQRFHSAHDLAFDLKAITTLSGAATALPLAVGAAPRSKRALGGFALVALGAAIGLLADRTLRTVPSPVAPTYRRLTFDRGTMGAARFTPDGSTVVFDAAWRGEETEVFTTRIDSHESRPLGLRGAIVHAVSSASELAVGLGAQGGPRFGGGILGRVPLAGGAPREVLENVTWADWSPDGADLAVVRLGSASQRVEFPIGNVLYETKGNISHFRVSPRGDWVAFLDHPPGTLTPFSAGSLVAVDRTGARKTLSSGWADLYGLAWRPDGREVWFTAGKQGEFKALRAVTLAGGERLVARMLGQIDLEDISRDGRVLLTHPTLSNEIQTLVPGVSQERDLTWLGMSRLAGLSEDGSRVLFTELPEGAGEGGFTYLRKTDGSLAVRLGEGVAVALSPDGKWASSLLASSSRLVLLPTGAGEAKDLTRPGMAYGSWGDWFPDSRRVVFLAEANGAPPRAYMQDIEGGEPRALGPEGIQRPIVSPDGRTVAALAQDGKPFLYPTEGGEPRPLRGLEPGDLWMRWSADGRSIFFYRNKGFAAQVYRLDLATGRRELLRELTAADPAGVSLPFVCVTPDGKAFAYGYFRNLSELYLIEGLK